jgi:hypothetical protein
LGPEHKGPFILSKFVTKMPVADLVALFVLDSMIDVTANSYCIIHVGHGTQCRHHWCVQFLQTNFSNVKKFKNKIFFKSVFSFRIPTNLFLSSMVIIFCDLVIKAHLYCWILQQKCLWEINWHYLPWIHWLAWQQIVIVSSKLSNVCSVGITLACSFANKSLVM